MRRTILKRMLSPNGKPMELSEDWCYMVMLLGFSVAALCTHWSCNVRTDGIPARRALSLSKFDVT